MCVRGGGIAGLPSPMLRSLAIRGSSPRGFFFSPAGLLPGIQPFPAGSFLRCLARNAAASAMFSCCSAVRDRSHGFTAIGGCLAAFLPFDDLDFEVLLLLPFDFPLPFGALPFDTLPFALLFLPFAPPFLLLDLPFFGPVFFELLAAAFAGAAPAGDPICMKILPTRSIAFTAAVTAPARSVPGDFSAGGHKKRNQHR